MRLKMLKGLLSNYLKLEYKTKANINKDKIIIILNSNINNLHILSSSLRFKY